MEVQGVQRNILRAIANIQEPYSARRPVADTEIAERLGLDLQVVRDHLDLMAEEDLVKPLRFDGGSHFVLLRPRGRIPLGETVQPELVEETSTAFETVRNRLSRLLTKERENLHLIEERKAQYVLEVDVPLQLIKEERRLRARITELECEISKSEAQVEPARRGETRVPSHTGTLELTMHDPGRNELTKHLTMSIPKRPTTGERIAEEIGFRLYLLNNSDKMARYIQIEMYVKAGFLSYRYRSDPLTIGFPTRWQIDQTSDGIFRCFLEGGAELVCHRRNWRDVGFVRILVPHGEAEGGVIRINMPYRIITEEHTERGLLIVWLQEVTD